MSHVTTCPHCTGRLRVSDQITDKTLICPHCLADVNNPQPGFQVQSADINTDVRRGLSTGSIVLLVLIGFCIIGIAIAFLTLLLAANRKDLDTIIVTSLLVGTSLFGVLDVVVSIAIIRGFIRWGASGVRTPSVGKTLGIVFLSLGTIVAVAIFFLFACSGLAMIVHP